MTDSTTKTVNNTINRIAAAIGPPSPAMKAAAGLIRTVSVLIIIAAVLTLGVLTCEHMASCKAWQHSYLTCEQPGCKDRIAKDRPVACWGPQ
jgi:hypothetical protein